MTTQAHRRTPAIAVSAAARRDQATVRPLRPGDADAVSRLAGACSDECLRERFFGRIADPASMLVAQMREAVWEGGAVGAFVDGQMVAMAVGIPDAADSTWDLGVLVRDDWQGRRLGERLVRRLLVEAQRAEVVPVALVLAANRRAVHLVHRVKQTAAGAGLRVETC